MSSLSRLQALLCSNTIEVTQTSDPLVYEGIAYEPAVDDKFTAFVAGSISSEFSGAVNATLAPSASNTECAAVLVRFTATNREVDASGTLTITWYNSEKRDVNVDEDSDGLEVESAAANVVRTFTCGITFSKNSPEHYLLFRFASVDKLGAVAEKAALRSISSSNRPALGVAVGITGLSGAGMTAQAFTVSTGSRSHWTIAEGLARKGLSGPSEKPVFLS